MTATASNYEMESSDSGLPVGACRRIGQECIRGRRLAVAGGSGGWCERSKSAVKTPRGQQR